MNPTLRPRYRILRRVGAGGMGVVYEAQDTTLRRRIALKFLADQFSARADRRARFLREAHAAAALSHPNICTIYEVGQIAPDTEWLLEGPERPPAAGTPFIAMEYIEGRTLRSFIAGRPIPVKDALRLATEIAEALSAAHQAHIVHRDLKPDNVMIRPDGHVKILDFGLAKFLEDAGEPGPSPGSDADTVSVDLSQAGRVIGTAAYMSPEQARGGEIDARADLFSFGIVLYEMLTGRAPFHGPSRMTTLAALLQDEPIPAAQLNPAVPTDLVRILARCLEKDKQRRYQTASELLRELARVSAAWPASGSHPSDPDLGSRGRSPTEAIRALAVLPLENLSGDPSQDYFADGMTESLITTLAKIGSVGVISRTSVMQYRGTRKALTQIARELKVDAVLSGAVLRSGQRVRITAQLLHAHTDRHLWAEAYERDLHDILSLQNEIARSIATEIQLKVRPQEQGRLERVRRVKPEAYDAYLRGRHQLNRRTEEGMRASLVHFEQATQDDPLCAEAYSGMADAYNLLAQHEFIPSREAWTGSKQAATKALDLDETLAAAHLSLACVLYQFEWDWAAAEREFSRALELEPSSSIAHQWFAGYLCFMGRIEDGLDEIRRAQELDPLSLSICNNVGNALTLTRRYGEAIEQHRRTLEIDSGFAPARIGLAVAYSLSSRHEDALSELKNHPVRSGEWLCVMGYACAAAGKEGEARRILDEVLDLRKRSHVSSFEIAAIFAALGQRDEAFEWLWKAYEERATELCGLRVAPMFDNLRSDRRFGELLRAISLAE